MSGRLQNKKVVVTAAAHGIGKAIATEFAIEGAEVMATDIDGDALDSVTGIVGINTKILDVTDGDAVANFAAAMGTIDVLCNIAGFVHHGSVLMRKKTGIFLSTSMLNPCTAPRPSCPACWRQDMGQ